MVPDPAVTRSAALRPVTARQPEARPYLISPAGLRNLFIASCVAGVALIVVILTLASSNDQARYTPADETQYQRTLQEATETISATGVNEGGSTARIPIEEAISVVAAQGLEPVIDALATPSAEAAASQQDARPQVAPRTQPGRPVDQVSAQPQQGEAGGTQAGQPGGQAGEGGAAGGQGAGADSVLTAGQAAFEANCASCHQATGQGLPGAFPTLVGHVPALYNADRSYLINLLLYGLQGEIQVEGQPYNGVMPAWQQLSDDDIAGILNYVSTAWGNGAQLQGFQPYEAGEIAGARASALSAAEVYALRQELELSGDQ